MQEARTALLSSANWTGLESQGLAFCVMTINDVWGHLRQLPCYTQHLWAPVVT